MGNFGFYKLRHIALALRDRYDIKHFVETGTHKGYTTQWAASEFQWVTTIEINRRIYQNTKEELNHLENVYFVHGDSRVMLAEVLPDEPAIVWLDAHNPIKYDKSFSPDNRCPLREELAALKDYKHFVFIDDARYYTGVGQWPSLQEIERLLGYKVKVWEDVIMADVITIE